jgi:ATP-dependent RNA helicase RhlE
LGKCFISPVVKAGIGGFLYLEVLDASFSFDGVIGAFALTHSLVQIMIGLGIGAFFVRSLTIYFVEKRDKANLLIDLMKQNIIKEILVFVQNKYIGDEMLQCLESAGLSVESIYGNKPKSIIDTILNSFEQRKIQVLVTTDIAAKGIQIKYLSDILHYDFSENSSVYVNRIEIIRKLGNKSSCISFCSAEERLSLKNIQNKIGFTIPVAIF